MLAVSLIPLLIVSTISYTQASYAIEEGSLEKLTALRNMYIIGLVLTGFLVVYVAHYFARTITKPIENMVDVTERIASGDLTVDIENDSKDEIGLLAESVRSMQGNLKEIIDEMYSGSSILSSTVEGVAASSEEISASSSEISNSIIEISNGITVQSSKSEDVAKAMFDLTEVVQEVANNSQRAADDAKECNDVIGSLRTITEDLLYKMDKIKTASSESAEAIMDLDGKSKQIGEIVNLITSIADQTNLLALNAAIEAARAGEHGKGFAVVADEVRKLAENSGNAANQIADLIHEIQEGTNNAVDSMQHGTEEVSNGSEALNEAANVIEKVVESGNNIAIMVQDIAAAAQEQSASIQEISSSIDEVASITQQSASGMESTTYAINQQSTIMEGLAQSAQVLSDMTENLMNTIVRFKIDGGEKTIPETKPENIEEKPENENIEMREYSEEELELELENAEKILI
ncbi:methyl-accepting chemotaxis protein [Methanolobus bombayensis]|uniref:methyl-accepting chemotaxis protein n=1 Tax=Methanolobus bombayensis TaxID=38023 RepID=UPI001AE9EEAE|nr:HAMP domain-containing methyl-accepting chemotaxis protein [Methanolobus bombayensis]MBP1909500.1 methyl-accepting chemotaxis protein [Methanolobus bombayensis]